MKVKLLKPNSVVKVAQRILRSAIARTQDEKEKEYLRWGLTHIKDEDKVSQFVALKKFEGEDVGRRCVIFQCKKDRVMFTFSACSARGPAGFSRPKLEKMPSNRSGMTVPRTVGFGEKELPMPEQVFYHDSNDYRNRPLPSETMKEYRSRTRHWRSAKRLL